MYFNKFYFMTLRPNAIRPVMGSRLESNTNMEKINILETYWGGAQVPLLPKLHQCYTVKVI